MKFLIISLAYFILSAVSVVATPQIGDIVKMPDGSIKELHGMRIPKDALVNLKKWKEKSKYYEVVSSRNWKGYLAIFKLNKNQLYLTHFVVEVFTDKDGIHPVHVPLRQIFGKRGPIKVTWFSGALNEYFGKDIGYTHYKEWTRVYTFDKGRLVSIREHKTPRNENLD